MIPIRGREAANDTLYEAKKLYRKAAEMTETWIEEELGPLTQAQIEKYMKTYAAERGTIGNTNFVAIPYNAKAKEGAMVLANFLLSPEAQARKQDPNIWGDPTVLALDKLPAEDKARFEALLNSPPPELLRIKGWVTFDEDPPSSYLLQGVPGRWSLEQAGSSPAPGHSQFTVAWCSDELSASHVRRWFL